MKYAIYQTNGKIVSLLTCREEDLQYNLPSNLFAIATDIQNDAGYYVRGGKVIEQPTQPSVHHVFNYGNSHWELSLDRAWEAVLLKRAGLLEATDWRMLRAMETGVSLSSGWLLYRQALRDITVQTDPMNIVWPQLPG